MYVVLHDVYSFFFSYVQVCTPANWKHGEDVIIPKEMSDDKADDLFEKGFTVQNSYYRTTAPPDIEGAM